MAHLYRKKPVVVEARQFKGGEENGRQLCLWMNKNYPQTNAGWSAAQHARQDSFGNHIPAMEEVIVFHLPDGEPYAVSITNWIIQTVEGPFVTCSAGAFPHIYEKI